MFLILLVLVQRGRGGGLTGALGGLGGQSAFGAKAGDVFTRITIGAATVWILLCLATVKMVGGGTELDTSAVQRNSSNAPITADEALDGPPKKSPAGASDAPSSKAPAGEGAKPEAEKSK
jgi:preprotein translocase subunit SecG